VLNALIAILKHCLYQTLSVSNMRKADEVSRLLTLDSGVQGCQQNSSASALSKTFAKVHRFVELCAAASRSST
jgi:hypothetical protein